MDLGPPLEALQPMFYPPRKLVGRVYLPDLSLVPERPLRFFIYPVEFALSAYQTFQQILTVGHRFWWWGIEANSTQGGTFRVYIRDGKTRQPMMKLAANSVNVTGRAQHPFFMRSPHLIPVRRSMLIQVTDTSGATNNIEVALKGAIYDG